MSFLLMNHPRGEDTDVARLAAAVAAVRSITDPAAQSRLADQLRQELAGPYHYLCATADGRIIGYMKWRFGEDPGFNFVDMEELGIVVKAKAAEIGKALIMKAEEGSLADFRQRSPYAYFLKLPLGDPELLSLAQQLRYQFSQDDQDSGKRSGFYKLFRPINNQP